jgi:hypothetical protein
MVPAMRSKALLAKSTQLKALGAGLPIRIADLDGCELACHCEGCGRHFQLYPGHAAFDSRMKLVSLLDRHVCSAQRNGRACGGLPRRLVLMRDAQQWLLDVSGEWVEDDSAFWEPSDFEARAERRAAF